MRIAQFPIRMAHDSVIPAQAGTQRVRHKLSNWIPACAGMTRSADEKNSKKNPLLTFARSPLIG
jgi:hypothetical protein